MQTVQTFEVGYTQYLKQDGEPASSLPDRADDRDAAISIYRAMILTRIFDKRSVALQRTGRMGTFASSLGQEAVGAGTAAAMTKNDVFVPSFREQAALFYRGVGVGEYLFYWGGDARGSDFTGSPNDFPVSVPVGTHAPHAAGVALAMKLRREPRVAVCMFGDGATSKGDVYEAMNIAGAWKLPVVFVVNNNQWAISVPREAQTAAETIAQKAIAAGFPGEQVDGNDAIAVWDRVSHAVEKARKGGGPHMIEALTYRLCDHTTADDATRYRDDEMVGKHWKDDPIARLKNFLVHRHNWTKEEEETLIDQCAETVENGIESYLASKPLPVSSMFDHLFAELPKDIAAQRDLAVKRAGEADND